MEFALVFARTVLHTVLSNVLMLHPVVQNNVHLKSTNKTNVNTALLEISVTDVEFVKDVCQMVYIVVKFAVSRLCVGVIVVAYGLILKNAMHSNVLIAFTTCKI